MNPSLISWYQQDGIRLPHTYPFLLPSSYYPPEDLDLLLALDHELHECLGSTAIDDPGLDGMKQTYYPSSLLMS